MAGADNYHKPLVIQDSSCLPAYVALVDDGIVVSRQLKLCTVPSGGTVEADEHGDTSQEILRHMLAAMLLITYRMYPRVRLSSIQKYYFRISVK